MEFDPAAIGTGFGGFFAAVVAFVIWYQKVKKSWVSDKSEINIIKTLNEQIEIFSAQNLKLQKLCSDLHSNITKLREENTELKQQVQELKQEFDKLSQSGSGRRLSDKVKHHGN